MYSDMVIFGNDLLGLPQIAVRPTARVAMQLGRLPWPIRSRFGFRSCKKQVQQKRRYISDGSKSWRIEIKMVSQQIGIEICQPALVSPKISWVGQQQNQTLQDARAGRSAHRFQRSGRGPGLNALWNT